MKFIYLVPHSHYDVVWAFSKEDYLHIAELILKKVLKMIKETDFKFLIEQTYLLEQIEHRDPTLFDEIHAAISEGDIEIVDGQYLMPDPMIPSGEILVREILYGKIYCKDRFNINVSVAWASDGFGLNAQLPQIYKKAGYKWLALRRGLPKAIGSRVSEFLWEGLDGTKILSHWMPLGYRAGLYLDHWRESYYKLSKLAATSHILMPCGSGGAIPQEDIPEKVDQWNREHPDIKMCISTPRAFFKALDKENKKWATFKGELYSSELENIFPDVVSSRIRLKLAIRECQQLLILTEKSSSLAFVHGRPYPVDQMNELWRYMLFLAFHDVIPSCGIDEIYDEAWEYIGQMRKALPKILQDSVFALIKDKQKQHGHGIVVFNPNNWVINDWVEADVQLSAGWSKEPGVAFNGEEIPSETVSMKYWDDGSVCEAKLGFIATVPPLGYRMYNLKDKRETFQNMVTINNNPIETSLYKVMIDKNTGIIMVFDKKGQEIVKGNEIIIDEEIGDLYFHESKLKTFIRSESGQGLRFGTFKPEGFDIKKGPIRTVITYKTAFYCLQWPYYLSERYKPLLYRHKTVDICKQVILYKDRPRIDFYTKLCLKQPHVRIRLKFDTFMAAPSYYRQTQFGVIPLPLARTLEESIKVPSLSWINCEQGNRGLAFLTKGVPVNEIKQGEIYYTLLRSVSVLSADGISGPLIPTPEAMELGDHHYAYSIYPYTGNWKEANVAQWGFEFGQPMSALQSDFLPHMKENSTFAIQPDNLIVSALKKAENGHALILRFFETKGERCDAKIHLPPNIKRVKSVNLIEEEGAELAINQNRLNITVQPFEIISLKLIL